MNEREKAIFGQMSVYTTALKILFGLRLESVYPAQVDMTLDNLFSASTALLDEAHREANALKTSANVKV